MRKTDIANLVTPIIGNTFPAVVLSNLAQQLGEE